MESVFLNVKSFSGTVPSHTHTHTHTHIHTQADHEAQFILHIHTHKQSPSNNTPCSSNSQGTFWSIKCFCVCVCVRVMPSTHQGCIRNCFRNNDRSFYWVVRGPLILYWFNRSSWKQPGTFLSPGESFCGASAQRAVPPLWLKHCQWISMFPLKCFQTSFDTQKNRF